MCVDESSVGNEISCVDEEYCNKLVTYFETDENKKSEGLRCLESDNGNLRRLFFKSKTKREVENGQNYVGSTLLPNK